MPLLMTTLLAASDGPETLDMGPVFADDPAAAGPATISGAEVVRTRTVVVDLAGLETMRDAGGGRLTLNLFEDATFAARVERVATRADDYSLAGGLDGASLGRFQLVVHGDVAVGVIRAGEAGTYHIRCLADGGQILREIDPAALGTCGVTPEDSRELRTFLGDSEGGKSAATRSRADLDDAPSADNGDVHDVLVVYSNVAREAAGGTSAIRAEIQLAVDVANDAYADSGVVSRLRLLHMEEVLYDEDTGWDGYRDHLVRLGIPDDGYFDHVHELRDRLGADLVSLIVEDTDPDLLGSKTCGMAPTMSELSPDFEVYAFSVVSRVCSGDSWTLAHEVGHNQGCDHSREDGADGGLFPYARGHRFTGNTRGWCTIMAYEDPEGTWERTGHFSNPTVDHDGAATGVPIGDPGEAHNVSTINSSRVIVAGFRGTRYWVHFDSSRQRDRPVRLAVPCPGGWC